jgi:hypothetical protein
VRVRVSRRSRCQPDAEGVQEWLSDLLDIRHHLRHLDPVLVWPHAGDVDPERLDLLELFSSGSESGLQVGSTIHSASAGNNSLCVARRHGTTHKRCLPDGLSSKVSHPTTRHRVKSIRRDRNGQFVLGDMHGAARRCRSPRLMCPPRRLRRNTTTH